METIISPINGQKIPRNRMSEIRQNVHKHLLQLSGEPRIRETEKGFKVNTQSLNQNDIKFVLDIIPAVITNLEIKRSGTGLVIIIE